MSFDDLIKYLGTFAAGMLTLGIPRAMQLRRENSTDAKVRAKDAAETDYFDNAVGAITIDRDKWRATADEAWKLLRASEAKCSRLEALGELHEKQLADKDRQIDRLWDLMLAFAPDALRPVLEVEFNKTGTGQLDSTHPTSKGNGA